MKRFLLLLGAACAFAVLPYMLVPPPDPVLHGTTLIEVPDTPLRAIPPPDPFAIEPASMVPLPAPYVVPIEVIPCEGCPDRLQPEENKSSGLFRGKHLKPLG